MTVHEPLFPDVGVLGLIPDPWGDPWLPRHQVMTRLSRFFQVLWMDPPQEWRTSFRPSAGAPPRLESPVPRYPSFTIYRPGRRFPQIYRPEWLAQFVERARLADANAVLRRMGARRTVLYLWRPEFERVLDLLPHSVSCYHVDDEYSFSETECPTEPREARLLTRADQVIVHSPALWDKKHHFNESTVLVPNGVDYRAFATPAPMPVDLARIPGPRIGYVGVIKQQLDFPLLLHLAAAHTEWSFVFVGPMMSLGPDAPLVARCQELPNVHFLGAKPVGQLPEYAQHLDVCLMPYDVNDYTKYIYPLKLHEYLAAGRPVVASPLRTLLEFMEVISIANSPIEWEAAISRALDAAASTPPAIARRRECASRFDWDDLVRRIAGTLCARLGPDYVTRFEASSHPGNSGLRPAEG